jgi:hypothetical protein
MTRAFPFGLALLIGLAGATQIMHAADAVPKLMRLEGL